MASLSVDEAARLYSTLHHFFEVAVHAILYYRRLYPERAFAAATAFDVPVHQSRHPAVCAWVQAAVDQVMAQIAGGEARPVAPDRPGSKEGGLPTDNVNAVAVVVHAPYETSANSAQAHSLPPGAVLERWVFDVRHLPRGWPGGVEALRRAQKDSDKRGRQGDERERERRERRRRRRSPDKAADGTEEGQNGQNGDRYNYYDEEEELANAESEAELDESASASDDDDNMDTVQEGGAEVMNWKDLNDQLRGVLQRLAQAGQQVASLPDSCTFTMAIELGDGDNPETGINTRDMDINWIPETGSRKRKFGGRPTSGAGALTTSIRSVDSAPLFLECWVEESAVKKAAAEGATSAELAAAAGTNAGDMLPPPPTASASTATSYGLDISFSFDKIMAQDSFLKEENTPQTNKGKAVSFS